MSSSKQMNINAALLREKLPQAAEQLKDAPTASLLSERALFMLMTIIMRRSVWRCRLESKP